MRSIPKTNQEVVDVFNQSFDQLTDYDNSQLNKDVIKSIFESENTIKVFHFWASWCEPCLNEIPDFVKFAEKNQMITKSKATAVPVKYFIISLDSDYESLKKFNKIFPEMLSKNFIQVWDKENNLSKNYNIEKLPATMIVYTSAQVKLFNGVIEWKNFGF